MSYNFRNIFLSWRPGIGKSRTMVGLIERVDGQLKFKYLEEGVESAKKKGFVGYPGLPLDQNVYSSDFLDLFSKRIIDMSRNDIDDLLTFWKIDKIYKNDTLYMLAMTQGKMQTDGFEFLACFIPTKQLVFVTDIAGLFHTKFNLSLLKVGSKLNFEKETDNEFDQNAIKILYNKSKVGYIKKGHNDIFLNDLAKHLDIEVTAITNTNMHKELYVKIYQK